MQNVQIQHDGKWIHFSINSKKVIGQTEKGAPKIAEARWEKIEGTDFTVMLMVIEKKPKANKTEKNNTQEKAPAIKKTAKQVQDEPESDADAAQEIATRKAARKAKADKRATKPAETKAKPAKAGNNNRPKDRPKRTRAAEADYTDVDF